MEDPPAPPRSRIQAESEAESKDRGAMASTVWATLLGPVLGGTIVVLGVFYTSKNLSADWKATVGESMHAATTKWMEGVKKT